MAQRLSSRRAAAYRILFVAALLPSLAGGATAQTSGTKPANTAAGAPAGSYALSGLENINLFSGNLNFHLPLFQLKGRGGASVPSVLSINSVRWKLKRGRSQTNANDDPAIVGGVGAIGRVILDVFPSLPQDDIWDPGTSTLYSIDRVYRTEMVLDGTVQSGEILGETLYYWPDPDGLYDAKPGYGPGVLEARTVSIGGKQSSNTPGKTLTRVVFTAPDGTEFELRDAATGGEPFQHQRAGASPQPYSRGTLFVSADGGSARFTSDAPVLEYFDYGRQMQTTYPTPSGYLLLADGTRYRIVRGNVAWIRDRNGNLTTFEYENPEYTGRVVRATDSAGREVRYRYGVRLAAGTPCPFNEDGANPDGLKCGYDEISYYGGGRAPRSIKVWYAELKQALRGDCEISTFGTLFPKYEQAPIQKDAEYNPDSVVTAAELPDGRRYLLRYNAHGELARVELPTGGAFEYDYVTIASFLSLRRRLQERRVYEDAADETPESAQKYAVRPDADPGKRATVVTVEQRDGHTNQLLSTDRHHFHGSPTTVHRGFYTSWLEGREFMTEALAADGETPLRRVEHTFEARSYPGWYLSGQPQVSGPAVDPRLRESRNTVLDSTPALSTKQVFYYDGDPGVTYNLRTKVEEYGFGGELLRRSETEYLKAAAYAEPPVHLRGLPLRRSVYDAGGQERARTTFEYDKYTADHGDGNRHAALVAYGDIFGLCTAFDAAGVCSNEEPESYETRGNVTGVTSYLLDAGGNVTGSVTANGLYDIAGNVVKIVDARVLPGGGGYETAFDFGDNFGLPDAEARANTAPAELVTSPGAPSKKSYALPRSVTDALGHTTYAQYDYHTGQVVNTEDAEGQVTRLEYVDPLSRLTRVTPPAGGGPTEYEYGDEAGDLRLRVRKQVSENRWDEGVTFFDNLGRTTKTLSQDALGDVFSETAYDPLGRIRQTCSPYRAGDSKHWVETSYDALGRVREVVSPKIADETTPAKLATEYSAATGGAQVGLVQIGVNQAGKRSRSITNALGQLVRVDEPDEAGELGPLHDPARPTHYTYDTLGNLIKVEQGGQTRFFLYDSLGRLIRVRQPEQDTNPDLALSDPLTGNGEWSAGLTYDENGSVETTTDARGVTVTYEYDSLGRVTRRSYAVPQTADPKRAALPTSVVTFKYDGLLSATPGDPAPTPVPFAAGRLTEISNGASTTQYTEFDNLGRVESSRQVVDGQVYPFSYKYNLAGEVYEEVYPSGRVITNAFDAPGDLSSVSGHAANQAPKVYVSDFKYRADGAVERLKLGNGKWETYGYNAREQVTRIGLGTSAADTSLWRVDYEYGRLNPDGSLDVTKNDGNLIRQTINVPGAAHPYVQTYGYDPLNRLTEAAETAGGRRTWSQTFGYDRYGNRTEFSQVVGETPLVLNNVNHPEADPLTNRFKAGQGYEYDLNGNLIRDAEGRGFSFDGDNRQGVVRDDNNNVVATYGYDGGGRRVRKTVAATGEVTVYVYDAAGKLAAEYSNVQPQKPATRYVTADILNTPRVITDAAGEVLSRKDYTPFGEELSAGRSTDNKYGYASGVRRGFTGYERDEETRLDFAEARYYNPRHGRFTAVDPLLASGRSLNPQTFNRYAYAGSNPTLRTDPNGEDWFESTREVLVGYARRAETHYKWDGGGTRVRSHIVFTTDGPTRGLTVLDKWENRFRQVASVREGREQFEAWRRQAALNYLAGVAESLSLAVEWSGALDGLTVERDSEQYRAGQTSGLTISVMSAVTGGGGANFLVNRFGKAALSLARGAKVAVTGLKIGGKAYKEIALIGKLRSGGGYLYRIGEKGSIVYSNLPWSLTKNLDWMDDLIKRGVPFEIGDEVIEKNLKNQLGRLTPFGAEITKLRAAGYQDVFYAGRHYMIPGR